MARSFTLTYDYLCPFAHIANEVVIESIDRGDDVDVRFSPFSLTENSSASSDRRVWELPPGPGMPSGVLALLWSLAVRDAQPERFASFHLAVFGARHDDGADINDPSVLASIARSIGVDVNEIEQAVASGRPSRKLADEHTSLVEEHGVFGVPTFISGDEAVFVRFMERHKASDLDRVLSMIDDPTINEFKRTRIPR